MEEKAEDLDALEDLDEDFQEESSPFDLERSDDVPLDVRNISLDDIFELPNIRPAYHGIENLAETIYVEGQLQPCLVRPALNKDEHDKPFELIFGYRRKRAIEFLRNEKELDGFDTLRCEVREVNDDREIANMIVENMQRETLSPVAEATAMLSLKKSSNPEMTNTEIANKLGCDPSHVSHRISMVTKLALPEQEPKIALNPVKEDVIELEEDVIDSEEDESVAIQTAEVDVIEEVDVDEEEVAPPKDKKRVDILGLVDQGKINASTAEVISSLDKRDDMEKLAELVIKNDWGVRRAEKWVNQVQGQEEELRAEEEAWGALEMVQPEDVVEIPVLNLRSDLAELDFKRINAFALLRNGLDQEMILYLRDEMDVAYEDFWDYVAGLSEKNLDILTSRLLTRYITSAHRYHSLGPTLIDDLADPDQPTSLPSLDEDIDLEFGENDD
jgi:ParB/RepB/Spo0J family partition protein